jgi:anaerobic selenocysteine-containing dehydrogenase
VFTAPRQLNALSFGDADGRFRLLTMRSNDQFNTTIYGYSDRFRGIEGTRDIVLMSRSDIDMAGLAKGRSSRLSAISVTVFAASSVGYR